MSIVRRHVMAASVSHGHCARAHSTNGSISISRTHTTSVHLFGSLDWACGPWFWGQSRHAPPTKANVAAGRCNSHFLRENPSPKSCCVSSSHRSVQCWRTANVIEFALRTRVAHRVGVAFSEGPKLLPFYENLAKWQLLPLYAHIL
jgi:hypothetical protein